MEQRELVRPQRPPKLLTDWVQLGTVVRVEVSQVPYSRSIRQDLATLMKA